MQNIKKSDPTTSSIDGSVVEKHIEILSQMISEMGTESNRVLARAKIRSSLQQSFTGLQADNQVNWYDWVSDTFLSLGLRDQTVVCSQHDYLEMAADGAQIITYNGQEWLTVLNSKRGKVLVNRSSGKGISKWIKIEKLHEIIYGMFQEHSIPSLVLRPDTALTAEPTNRYKNPVYRLWGLLRPEWNDIWVIIVFAIVIGVLALATPIAVETLVNTVAFGRSLQPLVILTLMLLAFLAFSAALRALQTYMVEIIQRRLFTRVVADISNRLPSFQTETLQGHSTRELVNRFFDIVVVQKVTAQLLLDGVSLLLGTLIGMAMLAFYHPFLLGFDILLLGMIALIIFVLGSGAVKTSIKESKVKYKMASWLEDIAGNPTTFRYEGTARFALEHADQIVSEYLAARSNHFRILMRQIIFALGMQAIASAILLGLGGWLVITKQLTLGQLVAAELIVAVIVGSFAKIGKHMESFYDLVASVDKLGVLFDLPLERQDGLIGSPPESEDVLEVNNLEYKTSHGHTVFSSLSFVLKERDHLAIYGESGTGKSRFLDILFGLNTPSVGNIKLMGADIREFRPEVFRRYVALVREDEIFEGTILENITVGRPAVTLSDVRSTLEKVGLRDDILSLPNQLDTKLTSTGYPLTTNQQHRLMLARACAGEPSLLLIDGTLDVLPDEDAEKILKWILSEENSWKLILVTGRQKLIKMCEKRMEFKKKALPDHAELNSFEESTHA